MGKNNHHEYEGQVDGCMVCVEREREREREREKRREKREMTEIHVQVLVHKLLMCAINFPDPSYTADQCRNLSVCAYLVVHSHS